MWRFCPTTLFDLQIWPPLLHALLMLSRCGRVDVKKSQKVSRIASSFAGSGVTDRWGSTFGAWFARLQRNYNTAILEHLPYSYFFCLFTLITSSRRVVFVKTVSLSEKQFHPLQLILSKLHHGREKDKHTIFSNHIDCDSSLNTLSHHEHWFCLFITSRWLGGWTTSWGFLVAA